MPMNYKHFTGKKTNFIGLLSSFVDVTLKRRRTTSTESGSKEINNALTDHFEATFNLSFSKNCVALAES